MSLKNDQQVIQKDLDILLNRKKNIHLVCDQVSSWSQRVLHKLSSQAGMQPPKPDGKRMSEVFASISSIVCKQLEGVIAENKAQGGDFSLADDFNHREVGEIATEDFVNKNIRVRPTSSFEHTDKDERQSDVY